MTSSPPSVHRRQIDTTPVANGSSTTSSSTTRTPWSCETNWTVTRGSLESAVTFESFDFPIDSESTGPKPPLLLVPQSPSDCEPCEIKLNFSEKQEIRQVYVRSTGRNYEIYYATHPQSENEYLCTVRCSAVEADVANAVSVTEKGKVNNEDDWVEINTYSPRNHDYQNYYEATAEINDSEPCTSLTLRLLSLQSKAFVYIEEIYVFADCIGTYDSDSQIQTANPEASLMTMLVPTLLGLSKSTSLPKSIRKPVQTESSPEPAELTRSQVAASSASAELTRCHMPSSTSDKQIPKTSHDPNTAVLEQLVSRVSRVEDILLRFEQKMLIPITNIEARLQHLEQQVELLSKHPPTSLQPNPQHSPQELELQEPPPKKYVSIDEALAAALVGFSSDQSSEQGCLASESLEPTSPHHQNNEVTKSLTDHPQDLTTTFCDASTSEITNGDINNDNDNNNNNNDNDNKTEDEIVMNSSSLDKNDILKYYPDQCPDVKTGSECGVDFETCILEVKFDACLDNGDVEAFLSCTDDNHNRTGVLVEETSPNENENTLLVELDGQDVLQHHPDRHLETSFDSLI